MSARAAVAPGFETVVFDCDSTLVAVEGIDLLAGEHREAVARMTDAAMDGQIPLDEVYGRRLELIRPTRDAVDAVGRAYVETLVPDARETVAALLWLGKAVRILSGGLRPPVEAVARELGLGPEAVQAVGIRFDERGEYAGFDRESPLSRNGGKPLVLRRWGLAHPALLVGDGATDLEGRSEVDCFAAYMGVVNRPAVAAAADIVLSSPSLAPVLALAATDEERARLRDSEWAEVLRRGSAGVREY